MKNKVKRLWRVFIAVIVIAIIPEWRMKLASQDTEDVQDYLSEFVVGDEDEDNGIMGLMCCLSFYCFVYLRCNSMGYCT